jgi:hypothetical protein
LAGFAAISAVGKSIERHLNLCFGQQEPLAPMVATQTRAALVRTEDFTATGLNSEIQQPALSVFLYRVDFNKTMRAAWSGVGHLDGRSHLPVDLHFLLTPWAENAEYEHRILGRTMQCLEDTPILSGPSLYPVTEWATNEAVQIMLEEITTEAVMRTFDSLPIDYRLSVPYFARVVRIDGRIARPSPDVVKVVTGAVPSVRE